MTNPLFCRVAALTSVGRGAVATVVVWGAGAESCLNRRFVNAAGKIPETWEVDRVYFGRFRSLNSAEEELVVCRVQQNAWEIHCHGGTAAVQAVISALVAEGATQGSAEDWQTEQGASLLQREASQALAEAATERTATILLRQYQGRLAEEVEAIESLLLSDLDAGQRRLQALLGTWSWGQHLTRPWQIVLCGLPNVGKSSLINALVGYERAIVQDLPGTTRDVVTTHIVCAGWAVALSDTAGWRRTEDPLEQAGIVQAEQQIARADLLLVVADVQTGWTPELQSLAARQQHVLPVVNKVDLFFDQSLALTELDRYPPGTMAISARSGAGIPELVQAISQRLVATACDESAVLFTERQYQLATAAQSALAAGQIDAAREQLQALRGENHAATI